MKAVIVVMVLIIGGLAASFKYNSHPPVVVEDYDRYKCRREDPISQVRDNFNKAIYTFMTKEYKPSGVDDDGIIISGYTFWEIEITRAHYSCDGVRVLKNF